WSGNDGPFLAEAAYFTLLGLGLLSFFLNRRHLSGWRLAIWIGFALPGAWRTCLTPFFAVVASPIAALNMQDFLFYRFDSAYSGMSQRRLGWPFLGRFLVLASGLGLIFLAVSGRLRGMNGELHPICWAVQPDPSLQRLAETLATWRQQGQLHEG